MAWEASICLNNGGSVDHSVASGTQTVSSVHTDVESAPIHTLWSVSDADVGSASRRPKCSANGMWRKASTKYHRKPSTKRKAKSLRTSCLSKSRVVR